MPNVHLAFGTRAVEYNPKLNFTVNILEAFDNKPVSLSLHVYSGSLFTSNPIYADDNAETGGDRPVRSCGSAHAATAREARSSRGRGSGRRRGTAGTADDDDKHPELSPGA